LISDQQKEINMIPPKKKKEKGDMTQKWQKESEKDQAKKASLRLKRPTPLPPPELWL
jgi:hypothetical protein